MTHFWHFLTIFSPSVSPTSVSFLIKFVWYPGRKSNTTFSCVILWSRFILLRLDLKSIYFSVFLWSLSWISPTLQIVPSNIMNCLPFLSCTTMSGLFAPSFGGMSWWIGIFHNTLAFSFTTLLFGGDSLCQGVALSLSSENSNFWSIAWYTGLSMPSCLDV